MNRDATVYVDMLHPTSSQARNDVCRRTPPLLHDASAGNRDRQVDMLAAQDHDQLLAVWPRVETQNDLKRLPADDDGVDGCNELVVAVRLSIVR